MPKRKLDAAFCSAATCPEGKKKETYWDNSISGFVLEVRSTGGKTYYLRYFDDAGRQRQHKIAGHADVTFDQAKKVAQRLRSEVVLGGDPAAKKDQKRAVPTYASLAAQHIEHAKTYQKRPDTTESVINRHIVPRFGKLRLDEITQQDVTKWLAEKRDSGLAPATVEKLRVTLGRSFALASCWSVPGGEHNPVRGISRPKFSNARERFLTPAEAVRLHKAVTESSNPQLKNIVGLLLLTGARRGELLQAKWQDVDVERKAWHIPDSKNGTARYVPLSQAAIDLIKQLPRADDCPWLVPNLETMKPFVSIKRAWDTARTEAGLAGLRLHDLRHAAASFFISGGTDLFTVGKILGHADYKSTMRYSHLANETLLAAVEAGATKLRVNWASAGGSANGL
jgi:integrase